MLTAFTGHKENEGKMVRIFSLYKETGKKEKKEKEKYSPLLVCLHRKTKKIKKSLVRLLLRKGKKNENAFCH